MLNDNSPLDLAFKLMEKEVGYHQARLVMLEMGYNHLINVPVDEIESLTNKLNEERMKQRQHYWDKSVLQE